MGDLFDWSTESNGGAIVEERSTASSSSSSLCSNNVVIRAEFLEKAEEVTRGIINRIQPNFASEERRAAVIDYVQRLIRNCLGCEVFPFGSVPLKTYLPDGDIDLTTFGGMNAEETVAHDVFAVLEGEDQNEEAEFLVKDVQLIWAEVKLIKCIIQNIVVDISFNQIGGLCTLCFLEQIDQLIGKDHLFKRSIILVKAWCYYESRILGAHHGLISTYALETLVLYIFHLFHSTLDAPLSVLHKFLDYYSKFDWDKYCVSLSGPVLISYLPEVVIDPPEIGSGELLLSKDFLKECVDKFSVPSKGYRIDGQNFTPKHLNIVDPLKENNNLGRSVSKGSFFRIRSAFSFGVRKLEKVLCDVEMDVANELRAIFSNTLDRHGSGPRPDVQDIASEYDNFKLSDEEIALRFSLKEDQPRSEQVVPSVSFSGPDSLRNSVSLADQYPDEVNGIVSRSSMVSNVSSNCLPSKNRTSSCQMGKVHHSPYCFSSHSLAENGERCNGFVDVKHVESYVDSEPTNSGSLTVVKEGCPRENNVMGSSETSNSKTIRNSHLISSPRAWSSEDNQFGCSGGVWASQAGGISNTSNTLADLTGDFENHLRSLDYCRWCHEYALMAQISHTVPLFLPQSQVKKSWDVLRRSFQNKRSVFTKRNHSGTPTRSTRCSFSAPSVSGAPCTVEEMIKPRGTGTYFSNMNHYRNRNLAGRGRNHVAVRSLRSNGHLNTSSEMDFVARNSELLQPHFVCLTSDLHSFGSLRSTNSDAKRSPHLSENALEFSPSGQSFWATSNNVANDCSARNSIILSSPVKDLNQDRGTVHSYRLKDEGDFPPLS